MNINQKVMAALQKIGVPVRFQTYTGTADTYITFFTYLDKPEGYADDVEYVNGYYVQVDVWSRADYTELVGRSMKICWRQALANRISMICMKRI